MRRWVATSLILGLCQAVAQTLALTLHTPDRIQECTFAFFSWEGGSPPYHLTYAIGTGGAGDASGISGETDCGQTNDSSIACYITKLHGKYKDFGGC